MSHSNPCCRFGCVSILALLAACAGDTVDLGSGQMSSQSPRGARCIESPIVSGEVHVASQAELDELAGCEQIEGNLEIEVFADTDLSPLASLRVVGGVLDLGARPEPQLTLPLDAYQDEIDRRNDVRGSVVADGYLPSLSALGALERVGNLSIYGVSSEDLAPLASLREITGPPVDDSPGGVHIEQTRLRSLHGLENVNSIPGLWLGDNPDLESLSGIALAPTSNGLVFLDVPKLTTLPELRRVTSTGDLRFEHAGIANLDDLAPDFVEVAGQVFIWDNPNLVNVDGLARVFARTVLIQFNPVLQSIPGLPQMLDTKSISILDNPELRSIAIDLPDQYPPYNVKRVAADGMVGVIDIGGNGKLVSLSAARGLARTRYLAVYENPSLESFSLGTLTRVEDLRIMDNASLRAVDLAGLQTVNTLTVTNNPSLDSSGLAGVLTFETTMTGNAGDPAAAP